MLLYADAVQICDDNAYSERCIYVYISVLHSNMLLNTAKSYCNTQDQGGGGGIPPPPPQEILRSCFLDIAPFRSTKIVLFSNILL